MKNSFIIALLVLSACSTSKNIVHNQQAIPFVADGKAKEWGDNLLYDPDSRVLYKVSNDENNLYLMLKITDIKSQRKMLMGGLTVWIDTTNHKKENFGVTFPRGRISVVNMSEPQNIHENSAGSHGFNIKERLVESELEIELHTYDSSEPQIMYLGESHLKPAIDIDSSQIIVYEFALPLGYFIKNKKTASPLSIGFVIGPEKPSNGNSMNRGQDEMGENEGGRHGGMGGGSGHRGMGGMHGGQNRGVGHSGARNGVSGFEPTKIWLKNYVLNPSKQK